MLSYVITKNDLFFYDDCEVAEHFLEVVISLLALQHVVQQAPGHHVVVQPGGLRPDAVNSPFHLHSTKHFLFRPNTLGNLLAELLGYTLVIMTSSVLSEKPSASRACPTTTG